ncbi:STAS domain-containing protein [Sphaerisporangium fuscum]|uniref:STAS domain-containing protein n=1 Tax=Sphaerisporangium fuscum TaxID=2835868 RepID=UPI001BDCC3A2|nr:STAS domain-containing protein [Sphaerisporangium fuscum]
MAFTATLSTDTGTATIHLAGELDASTAPLFHDAIEKAAATGAGRLVIHAADLTYIASAGLRALVFARQKLGEEIAIVIDGATEPVARVIRMAGLDRSFEMTGS